MCKACLIQYQVSIIHWWHVVRHNHWPLGVGEFCCDLSNLIIRPASFHNDVLWLVLKHWPSSVVESSYHVKSDDNDPSDILCFVLLAIDHKLEGFGAAYLRLWSFLVHIIGNHIWQDYRGNCGVGGWYEESKWCPTEGRSHSTSCLGGDLCV